MTSDFGVTAGHVEYSNRRFDFDTRHMVMIEVYRHTAALAQIGKVLDKLGYAAEVKKSGGKTQRLRTLPKRVYKKFY